MNVLVLGTGGALVASGITTMTAQLTATLRELGHDVERLEVGVRRRRRPNRLNLENLLSVGSDSLRAARAVRTLRPDVVWLNAFGVPLLPAMRLLVQVSAIRLARRKSHVVISFHAHDLEGAVACGGRPLAVVLRVLRRAVATVSALTEPATEALRPAFGDKLVTIPNWVEVPSIPSPLPPGPPWHLVFVGAVTRRKGLPELLDALRLIDDLDVRLRIIGGPGDEGTDVFDELRTTAADLQERGRVTFVGPVAGDLVRAELRAAHALVLPSKSEGMPLAVLEAMAEGRPVLTSAAGNMAELVARSGCGLVVAPADPPSIAAALRQLLAGEPEQMARAGHAFALERFSPAAARPALERVLREQL